MTSTTLSVLALLAIPVVAHADAIATNEATAAEESAPPDQSQTPAAAPVAVDARELRRGFHVGFSLGAAYLPSGDGAKVGVARLDLNLGHGRHEWRLSPIVYRASSNGSTTGVGFTYEARLLFGSVYTFAVGALVAYESTDDGSTSAVGVTFSPVTLRLGEHRNYELGLNALWVREPDLDNQNAGGYVSFTYLKI